MDKTGMTALVSAFARAQHARGRDHVYFDPLAERLLYPAEIQRISASMSGGIDFFCPDFTGTPEQALRWIVDRQLAPSPLGRAAFAEAELKLSCADQYLVLAAGLDTFGLRRPDWARNMEIFEVDLPGPSQDKRRRICDAGLNVPDSLHFLQANLAESDALEVLRMHPAFRAEKISFCSLLGISYYLEASDFEVLMDRIAALVASGSRVAMDYPARNVTAQFDRQSRLAQGAGEDMRAAYAPQEMQALLRRAGFCVKQDLDPDAITAAYFADYNGHNPDHPIRAAENVHYCLAEKI